MTVKAIKFEEVPVNDRQNLRTLFEHIDCESEVFSP